MTAEQIANVLANGSRFMRTHYGLLSQDGIVDLIKEDERIQVLAEIVSAYDFQNDSFTFPINGDELRRLMNRAQLLLDGYQSRETRRRKE